MRKFLQFLFDILRYLLWAFSFISLILIVPSLLQPLFSDLTAFSKSANQLPKPHFLIVCSFLFAIFEVLFERLKRKNAPRTINLSLRYKALYVVLAFFVSYLISKNFNFFNQLYLFKYILLVTICIWYLPHYGEYNVTKISALIDSITVLLKKIAHFRISKADFIRFVILTVLAVAIIRQSAPVVSRLVEYGLKQYNKLAMNPHVEKIEPRIVYQGTKVVIFGKNLGLYDPGKKGLSLINMRTNEKFDADLWTDNKVTFTVPLDWNIGTFYLRLQKNAQWEGEEIIVQSKDFKIKVISRTDGWDKEDDDYFNQLKDLNEEVLEINGYSPDQEK